MLVSISLVLGFKHQPLLTTSQTSVGFFCCAPKHQLSIDFRASSYWKVFFVFMQTDSPGDQKYLMTKYSGGSVMLRVCFSSKEPGILVRVHDIMNSFEISGQFKQTCDGVY